MGVRARWIGHAALGLRRRRARNGRSVVSGGSPGHGGGAEASMRANWLAGTQTGTATEMGLAWP